MGKDPISVTFGIAAGNYTSRCWSIFIRYWKIDKENIKETELYNYQDIVKR